MINGGLFSSRPKNEPVKDYYSPGEIRTELEKTLVQLAQEQPEIPLIIGGQEVRTGNLAEVRCPHDHGKVLATFHQAGPREVEQAVEAAAKAWTTWSAIPARSRLAVFLRAAELLATKYRLRVVAATMLNQSKTAYQAEIDATCELIDFYRLNSYFAEQLTAIQPESGGIDINRMELRPLEGFVFAVSPFNFTAIGGNLPAAPAMMGNVVLWKPASTAVFSNYQLMALWKEAGLPDGVINFVPGPGSQVGPAVFAQKDLAGIHFTGSTDTFRRMWTEVGQRIADYRSFPRLVGETGGKDFVVVHSSADPQVVGAGLIRASFEYQGQKCSAASRAYLPRSLWPEIKEFLVEETPKIKVGDVADLSNFLGAVIDRPAFDKIKSYLDLAVSSPDCRILVGGEADDSVGYFVRPTVVETTDPHHRLMEEEIFGPVLTVYVYPDDKFEEILSLCDQTSPYALTGSIYARDRAAVEQASAVLRHAAGNFYINDKPTGAVVGRQPFGGSRASGTNDKAGSILNLLRWTSPQTIKENLLPDTEWRYSFMPED